MQPNLVLTAGHCVREVWRSEAVPANVPGIKFVFGYAMQKQDADATAIPEANVFAGKEVVGGESGDFADARRHDWALVRLNKPVPASVAQPVTSWEAQSVAVDQRVFVIGFPAGLPLKYAAGARVRDASNEASFIANLDTFGGNSGSGVYGEATRSWLACWWKAISTTGRTSPNCFLVNLCPANGCTGETVSRLNQVRVP